MEQLTMKAICKELNGGESSSEVTFTSDNEITFANSSKGPGITAGDIDSGSASSGKVLTADGLGGADWETVGEAIQNLINLTSASGTLTADQLEQAQENDCFVKLTQNGIESFFRKYSEDSTTIRFTYVSLGSVAGGSAQIARQHIDVTIASGAYSLIDGELIDAYNKEQVDSAFEEITVQEG